jgi:hypothetical protein
MSDVLALLKVVGGMVAGEGGQALKDAIFAGSISEGDLHKLTHLGQEIQALVGMGGGGLRGTFLASSTSSVTDAPDEVSSFEEMVSGVFVCVCVCVCVCV